MNDPNLIPLINVIFLMLIFFMVSGTVSHLDIFEIELPKSNHSEEQINTVTNLYIDKTGLIAVNNSYTAINDLPLITKTILLSDQNQVINIKADSSLPARELVNILNILKDAGAVNLNIETVSN